MTLSRRRVLGIAAALTCAGAIPAWSRAGTYRWRGRAMGAPAAITLSGERPAAMALLSREIEAEITRLERIFSLFRADSDLVRLNRWGRLTPPPPELLEVLSLADAVHHRTGGAFDPTIQALWRLHARAGARGRSPDTAALEAARLRTGWRHLRFSPAEISVLHPGIELTLNGIAQGYIADRIADLLRARGYDRVLIDMGEISAIGPRPDGGPWRAGIATPGGDIVARLELADRALATSAPMGTVLDRAAGAGHLIDPRTGLPGGTFGLVSVSDRRAALADALSTAFCLLGQAEINAALSHFPTARIEYLGA